PSNHEHSVIHPTTKSPVTFETLLGDDPHQTSSLKIGPSLSSVNRPVAPPRSTLPAILGVARVGVHPP
ncbi:hypothetical protein NPIL_684501, partial [Nephila pilipes]